MLTLKRPRNTHTRYRRKVKQQIPQIQDLSDLQQDERRFRRCLKWGAIGFSFFIILKMFYLFDGLAWMMGTLS